MSQPISTELDLDHCLRLAKSVALEAGGLLLEMIKTATVREKGSRDLVTDADIASQALIRRRLLEQYPDHRWIGEEDSSPVEGISHEEYCWVVDPLDGTTNYAHGMHNYAVSIALVHRNRPLVGVVYDPSNQELYHAQRGRGAFLHDQAIEVSHETSLARSLVAASLPPLVARNSDQVQHFLNVMERCLSLRRLGSAALNLCYVAGGRLDGYWTQTTKSWDIAAGALICQEAGAIVCGMDGGDFDVWAGSLIAAASPALLDELVDCLR